MSSWVTALKAGEKPTSPSRSFQLATNECVPAIVYLLYLTVSSELRHSPVKNPTVLFECMKKKMTYIRVYINLSATISWQIYLSTSTAGDYTLVYTGCECDTFRLALSSLGGIEKRCELRKKETLWRPTQCSITPHEAEWQNIDMLGVKKRSYSTVCLYLGSV